jgi:sortase A
MRPILRWVRLLLLAVGVVSLEFVPYAMLDARLFQAYESCRLNKAISAQAQKHASPTASIGQTPPALEPRAPVVAGATLGRIAVRRLGIDVIIVEGTDGRSLQRGAGHIAGTAFPGEAGNVALAGHRDTFFRPLRNVRQDDEVTLTTLQGVYRYRVESISVVAPDDIGVLRTSSESVLTLVTCYPFYFVGPAPQRFLVRARRT